jgi:triacylglycerol lipase
MPIEDVLTPTEAAHIANNSYFALRNWINKAPVAGAESYSNLHNRVLGSGTRGTNQPAAGGANPTLQNTGLASGAITNIHSAATGFGTVSGFGYTLSFQEGSRKHAVLAMRGTREQLANGADLVTDARGSLTTFGGYGLVHKGFKRTFDSLGASLQRDRGLIDNADVVHCVGHSLGGAVATLLAAHYAAKGKAVRLYTFGSPRVGALGTHKALENGILKDHIYRVAHDLDPISMVGPFPYVHVNGAAYEWNNMTIQSPFTALSIDNHDMANYMLSVSKTKGTWDGLRLASLRVNHDNHALVNMLMHGDNPSWLQVGSAHSLALLLKLFSHTLKAVSTSLILKLTAIDFLAEILFKGLYLGKQFADKVMTLLGYAAKWAGIQVKSGAQWTATVISGILARMLSTLNMLARRAAEASTAGLVPIPLMLGSACVLTGCAPL